MNILVCVKAVPDFDQVFPFGKLAEGDFDPLDSVDDDMDLYMNRFDEPAVEEAVLIKQKSPATMIDIVSMGPKGAQKTIKRAIGMGADHGIHLQSSYKQACDAMQTAQAMATIAARKSYDLILTGVMSEDLMQFQVGPMLARLLEIPWATAVTRVDLDTEKHIISVEQELEGGAKAFLELNLPALVTIQTGINIPRYPSLSNMLRANKIDLETYKADSIETGEKTFRIAGYSVPEKKRAGLVIDGTPQEKAEKLMQMLKQKSLLP